MWARCQGFTARKYSTVDACLGDIHTVCLPPVRVCVWPFALMISERQSGLMESQAAMVPAQTHCPVWNIKIKLHSINSSSEVKLPWLIIIALGRQNS